MKPILSASALSMDFDSGGGERVRALSKVEFEIWDDEFICIIGSNGSGKTTLLNLICREMPPTSGRLCFRGDDIADLPLADWRVYLGRIYQNPADGLALHLTAEENLLVSLLKGRRSRLFSSAYSRGHRRKLTEELEQLQVELEFSLNQTVIELSGGQRQLLSLVMAYLQTPGILILDEPTASLDPQNREKVIGLLTQWADSHICTIIMVTHHIEVARCLSGHKSRTIVLHQGQIRATLKSEDFQALSTERFAETYYA